MTFSNNLYNGLPFMTGNRFSLLLLLCYSSLFIGYITVQASK